MKRNILKTTVVSVLALLFVAAPTTQASAGVGCCGGYGGYGHGYYPSAIQQRYTPATQSYTTQQAQPKQQTNTNNFDPTIFDIQAVLFEQGYYEGELDGMYGKDTKAALLQFQEDNDITKTDKADVKALKADKTTLNALGL